jgi:hypothetical protein
MLGVLNMPVLIRKIMSRFRRNNSKPKKEVEYIKTKYGEFPMPTFSKDDEAYLLKEYGIDAKKLRFGRGYFGGLFHSHF